MTEPSSALQVLIGRLEVADPETREFIKAEISAATKHSRAMDWHEVIRQYIAQLISLVLPGGALWIAYELGQADQEAAASVIGGLGLATILSAMWTGIRRKP